jgi:hypothetical protein
MTSNFTASALVYRYSPCGKAWPQAFPQGRALEDDEIVIFLSFY